MTYVVIGQDEYWPYPLLNEVREGDRRFPYARKIDPSVLKRWRRVVAEFEAVAEEIEAFAAAHKTVREESR